MIPGSQKEKKKGLYCCHCEGKREWDVRCQRDESCVALCSSFPKPPYHLCYWAARPGQPQGLPVPYTERVWHKATMEACSSGLIFYACVCQSATRGDGIMYSRDVALQG